MTTTESPSPAPSPVLVGQGLADENRIADVIQYLMQQKHELDWTQGDGEPFCNDDMERAHLVALIAGAKVGLGMEDSKAQDGLVTPPLVDRASASPAEPALRDDATVTGTRNFDHLAGRGMHELRHDELREYLVSVGCNYGPSSDEFVAAADWIVSELARKTNDERVLAVKLLRLHEAANAEQLSEAGSARQGGNTRSEPLQNLATSGHDATGAALDDAAEQAYFDRWPDHGEPGSTATAPSDATGAAKQLVAEDDALRAWVNSLPIGEPATERERIALREGFCRALEYAATAPSEADKLDAATQQEKK